jgi:hypothetical protein
MEVGKMKTTKMWALLVLALFVVSLAPFAAAQGGSGQGAGASAEAGAGAQAQATEQAGAGVETREEKLAKIQQIKSELMQKRVQVRAEIEGVRNAFQERYQQNKEQRKEMRQERKDMHQQWKEKRTELKSEREQARAELGQTKGNLAQCRGSDSADCQETRKQAKVQAGKFLTKASEHIIAVIEKAKERIQSSALSDEAKATLIADLEADVAEIDAAQEASAALDETATKEDLKAAADTIKQLWGKAKEDIKTAMGAVVSNRVGGIVVKMEKLADKFERVIAKLEGKGKDVGALKAKQADYQAKLDSAKALQEEAKVLIAAGDRAGANEKIKSAHQELKAANELLRGIVQEIRGAGGAEELESEPAESNEAGAAA